LTAEYFMLLPLRNFIGRVRLYLNWIAPLLHLGLDGRRLVVGNFYDEALEGESFR